MKIPGSKQGFSFVEILVAAVVAALIALVGSTLPATFKKAMMKAEERFQAIDLATSQIEDLKQIAEDGWTDPKIDPIIGASYTLTYIDPSDSLEKPLPLPSGFSLTYNVSNEGWTEDGLPADIDYKELTVTCTYSTDSIQIKTYLTE